MFPKLPSSLFLLSLQWQDVLSQSVNLVVSGSTPAQASPPIDPSFPGFAFEEASFYNYALDAQGNANKFSQNLINAVLSRTGGTPILRVGGTSGDEGSYSAGQSAALNKPATQYGPQIGQPYLSAGPSFFKAFASFSNAQYIFMVPLFHQNVANTVSWAQQGIKYIGSRLNALEIGNEPDLYSWYTLDKYVSEYNTFVTSLASKVPELEGKVIFQALDTSWGSKSTLSVPNAINAGLNKTKQVKQVAHHYYQGQNYNDGLQGLQSRIANHTAIAAGVSSFSNGINYLHQNAPRVPFVLSECGNTLGYNNSHQRNNLATALWNVDFQLYAMSIGVARVNMQQILQPGYGMWEPVASDFGPPMVRANFYSQPFVADFIGLHESTSVVEVAIPNAGHQLSAYAAYVGGKVKRIAVVNLDLWNGQGTRPSRSVVIKGLPNSYSSAVTNSLTAPGGAYSNSTLTYAGSQWTWESQGTEVNVKDDAVTTQIVNGGFSVSLQATSAILISLK